MEIVFVPSQSKTVQGKKYTRDWFIRPLGSGNGNWLLTKSSDVLINGVSYRGFILDLYNKSRLTESLYKRFRDDLSKGKVTI